MLSEKATRILGVLMQAAYNSTIVVEIEGTYEAKAADVLERFF